MIPDLTPPSLPDFDAGDPLECAVVTRLAGNWTQRASVKKPEPDMDDLFDPSALDFPEALLPFAEHPTYLRMRPEQQQRLRAWGWIAYNKNVVDVEKYVVNPGFDVLAVDKLGTGLGDWATTAVTQAMVDEQYHTLMHLNASAATRRGRGWALPSHLLPDVLSVRTRARELDLAGGRRRAALTELGFMTVAEVSITAYLDLISDDPAIQPINRATIRLHARDERCHASIASELAVLVWDTLSRDDRVHLQTAIETAMGAFSGTDYSAWQTIMDIEQVRDGHRMIADARAEMAHGSFLQDYSGIYALYRRLGVDGFLPTR